MERRGKQKHLMIVRQSIEPIGLQSFVPRPVPAAEQDQYTGVVIVFRRNPAEKTDTVNPEILRLDIPANQK